MPYVSSRERVGRWKGILEGIERGLKLKYGAEGLQLGPSIRLIYDEEKLLAILEAIMIPVSLEEIQQMVKSSAESDKSAN